MVGEGPKLVQWTSDGKILSISLLFQHQWVDFALQTNFLYSHKMAATVPVAVQIIQNKRRVSSLWLLLKTVKYPCMIKTFLNMIKGIYEKSPANIMLNSERLAAFPWD